MKHCAICYSTKDRVEFSRQTLPSVLEAADNFDLFIIDGSSTQAGRDYANSLASHSKVKEVHADITGGADVAIVYALSHMLAKGYEQLGLIENDVLLESGWFDAVIKYLKPGVGSVSARCYTDRILKPGDGIALMANIGAGMVIFSREGAECVLDYYRNGSFAEYRFWAQYYTGNICPTPHEISDVTKQYQMTADWFFESSMLSRGLISLACTPSMARSVDQVDELLQKEKVEMDALPLLVGGTPALIGHYDPGINLFSVQPHQIFTTFPEAFTGDWKLVWAKHNGPFGMHSLTEAQLTLPVYGETFSILLNIKEGGSAEVNADGVVSDALGKTSGHCGIRFSEVKQREVTFKFKGDVTVMTCLFTCPQSWFQDGYGLRYSDLAKYL